MSVANWISVIAATAAVLAAVFTGWQAKSANRAAVQAKRGADAAEAQARAVREQVELMRAAAERESGREKARAEALQVADVSVWKETRQPKNGAGAVIVVENAGPAISKNLFLEVRATATIDIDVLNTEAMNTQTSRTARKPELRPGDRWLIPLKINAGQHVMPIECSLSWCDERPERQEATSVRIEALGVGFID